ncbi:NADP-dependent malic enzyme [Methylolobus aquaticus]|nr:NADP-dependent malic enzyme [Methylolobus aquaticus]
MEEALRKAALDYHEHQKPGKISVAPSKQLTNQRDLALAYSPGVAAACEEIVADPANSYRYTTRGNLVGVITNGTAVLGLGDIGPHAAKPVMEGKAVLFKKFAGIDVFDIEISERDPDRLVDIIASLEPTFGGINLEDIKAPECFYIERKLRERMKIPVFHDDQHGTSIIVGAALLNALKIVGKPIEEIRVVSSGAGAAALACLDMLLVLGARMENILVTDIKGVVYTGRVEEMDDNKARYAKDTSARTLAEAIGGADVFLGLSAGGVLKQEMVARMAERPIIFALANPTPEILPDEVKAVRDDAVIATGRSDYPNQVNNVLCFPFIFRGALDVGATTVTDEMKKACVEALAGLAQAGQADRVREAYGTETLTFGPDYIIPKPFDPRLISEIAPSVARAAMASGVATRPIANFEQYRQSLIEFVYQTGLVMRPVFAQAKREPKRIVFCEGEDERVLQAVQVVLNEGLAQPILIGRPAVVHKQITRLGLSLQAGKDFELVDPDANPRHEEYWTWYHQLMWRRGVSQELAQREVRRRTTLIGAIMVRFGLADGLICGTFAQYGLHLRYIHNVIGHKPATRNYGAMNVLMLPDHTLFICDTYVNPDPTAEQLADITVLAAEEIRHFGMTPKVALLSHSSFGTHENPSAQKMRDVLRLIHDIAPELEVEGEMHGDAALSGDIRQRVFPYARMHGQANLLVMPTLDAANISFTLLRAAAAGAITVGPILLGAARPAHILTPSATVRRIVNMTAFTVVGAQAAESHESATQASLRIR